MPLWCASKITVAPVYQCGTTKLSRDPCPKCLTRQWTIPSKRTQFPYKTQIFSLILMHYVIQGENPEPNLDTVRTGDKKYYRSEKNNRFPWWKTSCSDLWDRCRPAWAGCGWAAGGWWGRAPGTSAPSPSAGSLSSPALPPHRRPGSTAHSLTCLFSSVSTSIVEL